MRYKIGLAILAITASATAIGAEFEDYAKVLSVSEKTERINTPREECTKEVSAGTQTTTATAEREVGGAIIGGLAGALIGSQVGKGNGKVAGAAVGAATGAIVGDRMQNNQGSMTPPTVSRCRMVDSWQTRSVGYEISYEYKGRTYTDTLPYRPGETLRLKVSVSPQR